MNYSIWSLFSGIGGLEKGLEDAGLGDVTLQCEIEEYPRSILEKHWPDALRIDDVRKVTYENYTQWLHDFWPDSKWPDILCGGFPCQPVSLAGKGRAQADERWLWPEFERVIEEFEPSWVVIENVPGLRKRGLGDVLRGLARLGYDAEWIRLSAAAVGAPHLRERLFVVAYAGSERRQQESGSAPRNEGADARRTTQEDHQPDRDPQGNRAGNRTSTSRSGADANSEGRSIVEESHRRKDDGFSAPLGHDTDGLRQDLSEPQPRVFTSDIRRRLPITPAYTGWESEPDICRVAYGVPNRVDRLKALGNAVVPQCAQFVGIAIREAIMREAEDGSIRGVRSAA